MKRILIIEDEEILLRVLKDRFEMDGWKVVTAVDGEQAIQILREKSRPDVVLLDLVLLDLILPKQNGFEVLQEIQGNPSLKDLPVIVLSNLGDDDDIRKAMSLGASDYFVKTQHPIGEILEKAEAYSAKTKAPTKA